MNNRDTIDTFYDSVNDLDIEIETVYKEGCKPIIKITAYKEGVRVFESEAEHCDRYFMDELDVDEE